MAESRRPGRNPRQGVTSKGTRAARWKDSRGKGKPAKPAPPKKGVKSAARPKAAARAAAAKRRPAKSPAGKRKPAARAAAPAKTPLRPRKPAETWEDPAAYERYMGRWSRLVAAEFVSWLDLPPGAWVLEVGCGSGALTGALAASRSGTIVACDRSPRYLAYGRQALGGSNLLHAVAPAEALPFPDGMFHAVVSGLVLNFLADQPRALAEMIRVTRPGGTIAAYVWDYARGMEMLRRFWDAAIALDPKARDLDEAVRFPVCHPARLAELFEGAGLTQVDTRAIDVPTRFESFEDYWEPFLGGQGPAPGYVASLGQRRRKALGEMLRQRLSVVQGRALACRAWGARGESGDPRLRRETAREG